jgi:hypothetical protein
MPYRAVEGIAGGRMKINICREDTVMWLKNCSKTMICVNGKCFDDASAAGRYVMELSSRGEAVSVTRQLDMSQCFIPETKKD